MYATTTSNHAPIPARARCRVYPTGIGLHLGEIYLSMTEEEAELVGNGLIRAAARSRAYRDCGFPENGDPDYLSLLVAPEGSVTR